MLIEVVGYVEEQLRDLSRRQGKDVGVLVKDAIREYLEAMAITDLDAADIATAQVALAGELRVTASYSAKSATVRPRVV